MRARVAWTLTLPILIVVESVGHLSAYRIVAPDAHRRAVLLQRTGHGYVEYLHPLVAICLALAVVVVGRRVMASVGGRAAQSAPSWGWATLPAVTFLVQEYLERIVHSGSVEWTTASEPAVVVGVALQIPCGLLAVWLVRALLRLAHQAGVALGSSGPRLMRRRPLVQASWAREATPLRLLALARGVAERGPPAFA